MQSIRDAGKANGDPNAPLYFDQDGDGTLTATGWIAAGEAKGVELYFKNYLQSENNFTVEEQALIQSTLPHLRDWYVQAGASGLATTDILNRGAFMLGGVGSDALAGDDAVDLLVGNTGDDVLFGGGGADLLIGGAGDDDILGDMNPVAAALHGADFVDGGATDVIAAHASYSEATGQFHCGNRRLFTDKTWRRHRSEQPCLAGRWVAAGDSNCGSVACAA